MNKSMTFTVIPAFSQEEAEMIREQIDNDPESGPVMVVVLEPGQTCEQPQRPKLRLVK